MLEVSAQRPDLVLFAMTWLFGETLVVSPDMGQVAKLVVDLNPGSLSTMVRGLHNLNMAHHLLGVVPYNSYRAFSSPTLLNLWIFVDIYRTVLHYSTLT